METITRFGVSIEPDLLKDFDAYIKKKKYTNRSEAIRDIIRNHLVHEETHNPDANVCGTLTMIYDHHSTNVTKKLLDIQHDHHHEILTTTHIHLDHHNCLEVLILRGKAGHIRHLADAIISLKGIQHGEMVLTKGSF